MAQAGRCAGRRDRLRVNARGPESDKKRSHKMKREWPQKSTKEGPRAAGGKENQRQRQKSEFKSFLFLFSFCAFCAFLWPFSSAFIAVHFFARFCAKIQFQNSFSSNAGDQLLWPTFAYSVYFGSAPAFFSASIISREPLTGTALSASPWKAHTGTCAMSFALLRLPAPQMETHAANNCGRRCTASNAP